MKRICSLNEHHPELSIKVTGQSELMGQEMAEKVLGFDDFNDNPQLLGRNRMLDCFEPSSKRGACRLGKGSSPEKAPHPSLSDLTEATWDIRHSKSPSFPSNILTTTKATSSATQDPTKVTSRSFRVLDDCTL